MLDLNNIKSHTEKDLLVSFLDIKEFAKLSKKISDLELVNILNDVFTNITNKISDTNGYVVKFIGDAILVIYDSDAIDIGLQTLYNIKQDIDEYFKNKGYRNRLAINCHYGKVNLIKFKTKTAEWIDVMGDTVQYAAVLGNYRARGLNKDFIISKVTFEKINKQTKYLFHRFTSPIVYLAN